MKREERDALLLVFSVALLLRPALLWQMRGSILAQVPILDGEYYYDWARRILSGDWKGGSGVYTMSPGYPYLLAVILKLSGLRLGAVYAVQCLASALSCALVTRIARRFFSPAASTAAGLLLAGYGAAVFYANILDKACWTELVNVGCLLLLLRGNWLLSGLCLGFSAQLRPNVLLFLPFLLAFAGSRKGIASSLLGVGLVVFPVALRNRVVGGEWVLTTAHGGMNFYTGNNPKSAAPYRPLPFARTDPKYEQDDFYAEAVRRAAKPLSRAEASWFWYAETFRTIRADVPGWLALLAKKFWLLWSDYEQPINQNLYFYRDNFPLLRSLSWIGYWLIAPLGLFGVLLTWRNRALWPLHSYLLAQILSLMIFFVVSEYRYPMTAALAVFAAAAFDWFRRQPARRAKPAIALLALLAVPLRGWTRGALAYRQDMSVAYNNLGSMYMGVDRYEEALAPLERSLAYISDYDGAHYNLGECLNRLNRPQEAKEHLLTAMRIHPGFVPEHFGSVLGQAYAKLGEMDKAAAEFKKAMALDPSDSDNYVNLAMVYEHTGRGRDAAATLDTLLAAQPEDPSGLHWAVEFAIYNRDLPRIYRLLPRLSAAAPSDPAARDLIGRALAASGHLREAKAEFERALALKPDFGQARGDLERVNRILAGRRAD